MPRLRRVGTKQEGCVELSGPPWISSYGISSVSNDGKSIGNLEHAATVSTGETRCVGIAYDGHFEYRALAHLRRHREREEKWVTGGKREQRR